MTALYFAYGSNLLASRLRAADRAPSAQRVTAARAVGFDLRFHKRGRDGSGKCDLFATGSAEDAVWGVVWRLEVGELERLDLSEGDGYVRRRVRLSAADRNIEAESYLARPAAIQTDLAPFDWYRDIVIAGARESRLPAEWIGRLERQSAEIDLDDERRSHFLSLLPHRRTSMTRSPI